jgi:hypothetical protein
VLNEVKRIDRESLPQVMRVLPSAHPMVLTPGFANASRATQTAEDLLNEAKRIFENDAPLVASSYLLGF